MEPPVSTIDRQAKLQDWAFSTPGSGLALLSHWEQVPLLIRTSVGGAGVLTPSAQRGGCPSPGQRGESAPSGGLHPLCVREGCQAPEVAGEGCGRRRGQGDLEGRRHRSSQG